MTLHERNNLMLIGEQIRWKPDEEAGSSAGAPAPDEIREELESGSTSQELLDAGKGVTGVNLNND